jgi:hypothetical protein
MPLVDSLSRFMTYLVFMGIGYLISTRLPTPHRPATWSALIVATLAVGYVGTNTELLSAFGIVVYLNALLQGIGIGLLAGFLTHQDQQPLNQ